MAKPRIKVAQAVPKNILISVSVDDNGIVQLERAVDGAKVKIGDFETELAKLDKAQRQLNQKFGITAQRIEDYARNLVKLAKTSAVSRDQHDLTIKKLAVLDKQYEELTGSSLGFVRALGQQSSNTGLAGATLTEFGRTISDANYGIRGVANNLSQLSSLFITLVAKQKESIKGMGKVTAAFRQLGTQMMGPMGIIIAFQLIITLLEAFAQKTTEAKEALDDFDFDRASQIANLERVIGTIDSSRQKIDDSIISTIKAYGILEDDILDSYKEQRISEEELITLLRNKLKLKELQSDLDEQDKEALENVKKLQEEQVEVEKQLGKVAALNQDEYRKQVIERGLDIELYRAVNSATIQEEADLRSKIEKIDGQINNLVDARNPKLTRIVQLNREIQDIEEKSRDTNKKALKDQEDLEKKRLAFLLKLQERINKSEDETEDQRLEREKENQLKTFDELFRGEKDYQEKRMALIQAYDVMINKAKAERHAKHLAEVLKKEEKAEEERIKLIKSSTKKALKAGRDELKEQERLELENLKQLTSNVAQIMTQFTSLLDEFDSMGQSRFQRQVALINRERDEINASTSMTEEEKKSSLDRLDAKENELQVKRIKAERDLFTVKKIIGLAEFVNTQMMEANMFAVKQKFKIQDHILTQKLAVQQLVLMGKLSAQQGALLMSQMGANAAKGVGDTLASQGGFLAQLGPAGIPLMALTIATTIASIIAARKKAKAEIASLTKASSSAGGSTSSAPAVAQLPSFNIVGASPVNQLASAIASKEQAPLKAQVVLSEVNSAQELERSTVSSSGI
jgi:hypothetical protein